MRDHRLGRNYFIKEVVLRPVEAYPLQATTGGITVAIQPYLTDEESYTAFDVKDCPTLTARCPTWPVFKCSFVAAFECSVTILPCERIWVDLKAAGVQTLGLLPLVDDAPAGARPGMKKLLGAFGRPDVS